MQCYWLEQFWLVTDSLSPDACWADISPKPQSMQCHKEQSRSMKITVYQLPHCLEGKEALGQLHLLEQGISGAGFTMESHSGLLNSGMFFTERTFSKALIIPQTRFMGHCLKNSSLEPVSIRSPSCLFHEQVEKHPSCPNPWAAVKPV